MFFTKIRLEEAIVNKYFLVFIKSTTNFCALWPGQKIIVNKNAIKPSFGEWGKFRKTLWNGECFGEFGLFNREFWKIFSRNTDLRTAHFSCWSSQVPTERRRPDQAKKSRLAIFLLQLKTRSQWMMFGHMTILK